MELMPRLSASSFKVLKVIIRRLEQSNGAEVQLSNRDLRNSTGLSRNTVRDTFYELERRGIKRREDNGRVFYSLKDELAGVVNFSPGQNLTSPNINRVNFRPALKPTVVAERLLWQFNRLSKSEELLSPERRELVDKFFVSHTDEASGEKVYKTDRQVAAVYQELLRALRGFIHTGKKKKFEEIFASPASVQQGSIFYYSWITGRVR